MLTALMGERDIEVGQTLFEERSPISAWAGRPSEQLREGMDVAMRANR